jgi:opacity protein-like surface antigen
MISRVGRPRLLAGKALASCWLLSLSLLGFSSSASADPLDFLRGSVEPASAPQVNTFWQGFYGGGHAGYSGMNVNFSGGVADLVANILRNTTVQNEFHPSDWVNLPQKSTTRLSYGGFIGYNLQFEDAVVGIEGGYNRTNMTVASSDSIARSVNTSDGYANAVTVSGVASVHLTDFGTFRLRGGWANGSLMPYAFIGLAIGRASISRSASVSTIGTDADPACIGPPDVCLPSYSFSQSQSEIKNNAFAYGYTGGAGVDWALTPNIFVRGEFEYIAFPNFYGSSIGITSTRLGAGLKF